MSATPGSLPREPAPSERAGADRSELAAALHELTRAHEVAAHEIAAPVHGAEIRRRAVRRRRRRHVSLAAVGASGLAAVSLVLTMAFTGEDHGHSTPPAATYSASKPPRADPGLAFRGRAAATVDLSRRELTFAGRILPISSGTAEAPTPTGRMTVTAKYKVRALPADSGDKAGSGRYEAKTPWVIQLRSSQNRTNYIVALTVDQKAPGHYDSTTGWIGLRRTDAQWLYQRLDRGAVVAVVRAAAPTPS
ncbi:L,D-transpeptidase [Streptomyces montanus]|uniref:L,D-transpeptidase n=1 Tax=Streptomyces montanus TaxID=2580423 RepID=A0A5R9FXT1_9ACTN|nr:L,D-transpeptidase [Streptomyces montanus]TLS46796.1 L,D-transpeptidase [Streptomyces montanus]